MIPLPRKKYSGLVNIPRYYFNLGCAMGPSMAQCRPLMSMATGDALAMSIPV